MKLPVILSILLGGVAVFLLMKLNSTGTQTTTSSLQQASCLPTLQEHFVPSNAREVGKHVASMVEIDTLALKAAFKSVIDDSQGHFDVTKLPPFRHQAHTREQSLQYINDVLDKVNDVSGRNFYVLDVMSIRRESSFDPSDKGMVDRYTVNLFVQEKDKRKVHAAAYEISMTFIVKPINAVIQIDKLYFISDHFYDKPLVDGINHFDNYFRIKNPFNLTQPFLTTDDKVLADDNSQIDLLKNHHRDLKTPGYRCFGATKYNITNQSQCEEFGGYWDKPVNADDECPFYHANKNYVNRLGGVHPDGKFCEMPVGTKRVGYRYVSNDPAHKPWCYNCKIGADGNPGSAGPCCDEQYNKQLYPNLNGPDYMFPGDSLERGQHWQELGERGLHWRQHPTRIRDINNQRQKQPVFNAIIGSGPGKIDPESFPN